MEGCWTSCIWFVAFECPFILRITCNRGITAIEARIACLAEAGSKWSGTKVRFLASPHRQVSTKCLHWATSQSCWHLPPSYMLHSTMTVSSIAGDAWSFVHIVRGNPQPCRNIYVWANMVSGDSVQGRRNHILVYWSVPRQFFRYEMEACARCQQMVSTTPHTHQYCMLNTPLRRYSAHSTFLSTQFTKPGLPEVLVDGASDMFNFATGRRYISSLHTVFTFLPRHDLFQHIATYAWTLYDLRFSPSDEVILDFKLSTPVAPANSFVWGIVDKDEMRGIKNIRWDLVRSLFPVLIGWKGNGGTDDVGRP